MRFFCLFVPLALAACASHGEPEESATIETDPRVGEEVERICFGPSINGFRTYGGEDALILRRGVDDEYLVTIIGVCPPLDFAQRVGLTDRFGGNGCVRQGDQIFISETVGGAGGSRFSTASCLIGDIYRYTRDPAAADEEEA